MKVSAISKSYVSSNYVKPQMLKNHKDYSINFEGKGGKILGGLLGGVAGGAAGGAIIGGGSLAGAALLAATGPIGWGLAALYTAGGAIAGSYLGSGLGDLTEDKKKHND